MNKRKLVSFAVILLSAAALSEGVVALHAQETPAAAGGNTMIRSETRLVLVDAVAVDKKNNFPRDLTQKDFRIWEDGKEQKITSFSLETAGVSPERSDKHYTILLFDVYGSSQLRERQETSRFLDGFATPDRYLSVVETSGPGFRVVQNFTNDGEKLKKALISLQAGSRGAASTATAGGSGGGRGGASTDTNGGDLLYRDLLRSVIGAANSVASIRGRKALILYSPGFNATPAVTDLVQAAIEACNKANVAVYTVLLGATMAGGSGITTDASSDGGGGRGGGGGGRGRGGAQADSGDQPPDPGLNALRSIADETGGFTFLTNNDLASGLGRIAREQDSYYLLGYTPAVESAEGTCHSLKVKVDRGGLEVRSREGYCTTRPAGLLTTKPAGQDLEARAAAGAGNIPAKLQLPWFYATPAMPNVAQVSLAMDAAPSTMKLQKVKGRLHGEFQLAGVASKPDGSVAGRFNDTVKLDFDTQQQADAFLKAPYRYVNQFEIAPGQYNFRMIFGAGDQAFAKVEMPLNIAAWDGKALSVSGIALSRDAHPFSSLVAGVDDSLIEGPRPLVSKNTEIVPTGTNQFHAGERAFFYFEIYEPLLAAATAASAPGVGMRIQTLDRATGTQKSDSGVVSVANFMRPGNPVIPIAGNLPADLPAGQYRLEVSAVREGTQDAVVRTVDFDVN